MRASPRPVRSSRGRRRPLGVVDHGAAIAVEVDRADIDVPEISKLGKYEATLKLHAEVTATVNFEVVPD